jgi:hypothetical protein
MCIIPGIGSRVTTNIKLIRHDTVSLFIFITIGNDTYKNQKRLKINLFTPAPRGVN